MFMIWQCRFYTYLAGIRRTCMTLLIHLAPTLTVVLATTDLLIVIRLIIITLQAIRMLEVDKLFDLCLESSLFEVLLKILSSSLASFMPKLLKPRNTYIRHNPTTSNHQIRLLRHKHIRNNLI